MTSLATLKFNAHNKLSNAIVRARLIQQPCELCGSTKAIHGHHEDYKRPFYIHWLCAKHHRRIHTLPLWRKIAWAKKIDYIKQYDLAKLYNQELVKFTVSEKLNSKIEKYTFTNKLDSQTALNQLINIGLSL